MPLGPEVVHRIAGMMPDQQEVTLYSRQSGDTFAAGVAWQAQRLPANRDLVAAGGGGGGGVAREEGAWRLFLNRGQAVTPQLGDKITDAAGVTWQVAAEVEARMMRTVYDCQCVRDV